jgi:ketosteroid isomerase-like protein
MSMLSDLERKIQILEDIEAIKRLKAKYWNSVDNKQWDNLADCLTEDFVFESPQLGLMEGKNYIVKVLKRATKSVRTAHQGHNPEIEITGETIARGRWALNDRVETADNQFIKGYGQYEEEYIKENGSWKINKSRLTYIFQESSVNP